MNKDTGSNWKLGMFVVIGLVLFVITIYFVGKQQNLFGDTFNLKSQFKTVSGLKVGNNVRFSGINVGTVSEIELINDSTVVVSLLMEEDVQKYIKKDATASIGSDGLMGDKVLTVSPGTISQVVVKDNDFIKSKSAIEMEDLMKSVKTTLDNAGIITAELAQFSSSMNNGNGTLSKLMNDKEFANSLQNTLANLEISTKEFSKFTTSMNNGKGMLSKLVKDEQLGIKLDSTMSNLEAGTKGLSENMEAAKDNFLLKGYFNKKKKAEAKKQEELAKEEKEKNKK
ncbi:phospholipid/cholesterol/gamma-HCH transport system substrate-binding protein [Flavobacterium fluvii]|uniref:Phospholipid/cholesterol/gamma-HCH transport system substrate-binding protein n=1 Tax=Flavobacterium fluvii TaxID=468056 RepID=A0A1M5KID8_9FLAO|nr:MlaD family protein [Flavobacterium fluvii]SHG52249.1 phospholipid/cholesterol/gamma-HCH transport system substrate-binding protein [Flavobacterium fluvii]